MTAYRYFQESELSCSCCGENRMDEDFMHIVEQIRERAGFPFVVTSAYRCPTYNAKVSSTGLSGPHTTGKAIDIHCYHENAHKLLQLALEFKIIGIGILQKGPYKSRFIHLDNARDIQQIWSY